MHVSLPLVARSVILPVLGWVLCAATERVRTQQLW